MSEQWHMSKAVPVSFLVGIAIQTAVLIWYIAGVVNMVENNARDISRHEVRIEALDQVTQNHAVMMARIDENLKFIRAYIEKQQ